MVFATTLPGIKWQGSCRTDARDGLHWAAAYMKRTFDRRHIPLSFKPCDKVYLALHKGYNVPATKHLGPKLSQQRVGPFTVLQKVATIADRPVITSTAVQEILAEFNRGIFTVEGDDAQVGLRQWTPIPQLILLPKFDSIRD